MFASVASQQGWALLGAVAVTAVFFWILFHVIRLAVKAALRES